MSRHGGLTLRERLGWKFLTAMVIAAGLVVYPMFVTSWSSRPSQLSAYGDDWNDLSDFVADLRQADHTVKSLVSSPIIFNEMSKSDKNNSVLVIVGVEKEYSEVEAGALRDYMKDGGNIILADDFGYGNSVFRGPYDAGVKFYGDQLYDMNRWTDPGHPHNASYAIIDVDIPTLGFTGKQLLFSSATALQINAGGKALSLASSSQQSFVDKDGDGEGGAAEVANKTVGGVPVIAEVTAGSGRMIVISDPSIFINQEYGELDNREFIMAVVNYLAGGVKTTVIFEESRHVQTNLVSHLYIQLFGYIIFASSNMIAKVLFLAGILLGLEFALMRVRNPEPWRHGFNVHRGRTSRYRVPHAHYVHPDTIRELFLERVRVTRGLSHDDFTALPASKLEQFLHDPVLVQFMIHKDKHVKLEQVMEAIGRWNK